MCDGRRFQADGAATEKELLERWRLNHGTIKNNGHYAFFQGHLESYISLSVESS